MKRFYPLAMLSAMALTLAISAGSALAQGAPEAAPVFAGRVSIDLATGEVKQLNAPFGAQVFGDVYDNTTSTATGGYTSTDLAAIMGDQVTTTGSGILDQNSFTVYNSGSSAGSLITASFQISLYDGVSLASLGSYTTSTITFTTPLAAGYYTLINVTGLSSLSYALGTNVIITQKIAAKTGAASRLGVVMMDPPTLGSSAANFYLSTTTNAAGWYTLTGINANPGYRINVIASTPTHTSTWGSLKNLYR